MNRLSRTLPNGATAYHQEAIYEIALAKYFGRDEFFGQVGSIRVLSATEELRRFRSMTTGLPSESLNGEIK